MPGSRGFTLVELLVTLMVLGVLLGLAAPLAASLGEGMRVTALANELLAQLHLARSEAIKRNGLVVVCVSPDGARCAAEGSWGQGWIVFHDANRNGEREPDETLVQRVGPAPAGFRLTGNGSMAHYVAYAPTGGSRSPNGAFQAGTLTICRQAAGTREARQIVISAVGRPRVRTVRLASCDDPP